jgi:hypothetical protein
MKYSNNVTETTAQIFEKAQHLIDDWRPENSLSLRQSGFVLDNSSSAHGSIAIKVKPDERNTKPGDTNVIFSLLFHNNETVLDLECLSKVMRVVLC